MTSKQPEYRSMRYRSFEVQLYLTLKHHPTTKLSIKTYIQNINYRNIDHFLKNKTLFGGHIGGHFMILYEVSLSLLKNMTAAHPLTESTFKTYIHNTST